ncbi:DUF4129 domain-containing protein [Amycolatopsis palatopharyngis]|uniref:DUF4129 domain-containing protein n=1 Tax=Amycolatopsis palatopharyngis TaxID=187982 RepID=UPI000E285C28|nr:DUF4129 domain-containing protein [Amycolatopsis palatopharyngis]
MFLAEVPVEIDREAAREAARAELADPVYAEAQPSWFDRLVKWGLDRIGEMIDGVTGLVPGGPVGLVVLVLVLAAIVVVIRLRVGKLARGRRSGDTPVFAGRVRSVADHRAGAERALAAGDTGEAVRERFRALVRGLEERGVLDERSGRTADEAAVDAGHVLPGEAERLRRAAVLFDDVHYGGRNVDQQAYQWLADLELSVSAARPTVASR